MECDRETACDQPWQFSKKAEGGPYQYPEDV